MTGCNSAIGLVKNLWKEYGDVAKKLGCGAAGVGTAVATSNPATGVQATIQCLEKIDKVEEAIDGITKQFNSVVSKTSSLTIGPRVWRLDTWEKGTIVGTTGRMFVTAAPMDEDEVQLTLRERGGKGKVGIAICCIDADGDDKKLAEYTLNENRSEKRDDDQEIRRTLRNVRGKWLAIHLDGKSVANTFKYKLRLTT